MGNAACSAGQQTPQRQLSKGSPRSWRGLPAKQQGRSPATRRLRQSCYPRDPPPSTMQTSSTCGLPPQLLPHQRLPLLGRRRLLQQAQAPHSPGQLLSRQHPARRLHSRQQLPLLPSLAQKALPRVAPRSCLPPRLPSTFSGAPRQPRIPYPRSCCPRAPHSLQAVPGQPGWVSPWSSLQGLMR